MSRSVCAGRTVSMATDTSGRFFRPLSASFMFACKAAEPLKCQRGAGGGRGGGHQQYLVDSLEHRRSLPTSIIPRRYHARCPQI